MKRIILFTILLLFGNGLFAVDFSNALSKELGIKFASSNTYYFGTYKDVFITIWNKNLNEYEDEPGFNTSQSLKTLLNNIDNNNIVYGFGRSFKINKIKNNTIVDYLCFSQYDSADIELQHNFIIFIENISIVIRMKYYQSWGDEKYNEVKKIFQKYALIEERYKTQGKSKNSAYDNELIWTPKNKDRAAELIRKGQIVELNDWYLNTQKIINICIKFVEEI